MSPAFGQASCRSRTVYPSFRLWSTTQSLFGLIAVRRVIVGRVWFLPLMRMSSSPPDDHGDGDVDDG
jgi:hypothetical protein